MITAWSRATSVVLLGTVTGALVACAHVGPRAVALPVPATEPTIAPPSPPHVAPSRASRRRDSAPMDSDGGGITTLLLRIRSCESGPNGYATHGYAFDADYRATNPRSTASGAWQVLHGTWAGYRGYDTAKDAPAAVQDAFALELYATEGARPWAASRACWGRR